MYIVKKENIDLTWSNIGTIRSHRERGTNFWHSVSQRHTGSIWNGFKDAVSWLLWSDGLTIEDSESVAVRLLSTL